MTSSDRCDQVNFYNFDHSESKHVWVLVPRKILKCEPLRCDFLRFEPHVCSKAIFTRIRGLLASPKIFAIVKHYFQNYLFL